MGADSAQARRAQPPPDPRQLKAVLRDPGTRRSAGGLVAAALLGPRAGAIGLASVQDMPSTLIKAATW